MGKIDKIKKLLKFEYLPFSAKTLLLLLLFPVIPLFIYFSLPGDSFKDFLLNFGTEMIGMWISIVIIGWIYNHSESKKYERFLVRIIQDLKSKILRSIGIYFQVSNLKSNDKFKDINDWVDSNGLFELYIEFTRGDLRELKETIPYVSTSQWNNYLFLIQTDISEYQQIRNDYNYRLNISFLDTLERLINEIEKLEFNIRMLSVKLNENSLLGNLNLRKKKFDKDAEIFIRKILKLLVEIYDFMENENIIEIK